MFEKSLQWTIRFESNDKRNFDVYVQSKSPKILWKKEVAVGELKRCAEETFSLTFEDQLCTPQLVFNSKKKDLLDLETLYLQPKQITVTTKKDQTKKVPFPE